MYHTCLMSTYISVRWMLTFWPEGNVKQSWARGTVDDIALTFQLHQNQRNEVVKRTAQEIDSIACVFPFLVEELRSAAKKQLIWRLL